MTDLVELRDSFVKLSGLPSNFTSAEIWERVDYHPRVDRSQPVPLSAIYSSGLRVQRSALGSISIQHLGRENVERKSSSERQMLIYGISLCNRNPNVGQCWDVVDGKIRGVPESSLQDILPEFLKISQLHPRFIFAESNAVSADPPHNRVKCRIEKNDKNEILMSREYQNQLLPILREHIRSFLQGAINILTHQFHAFDNVRVAPPPSSCVGSKCKHPSHVRVGKQARPFMFDTPNIYSFLAIFPQLPIKVKKTALQAWAEAKSDQDGHPSRFLLNNDSFLVFADGTIAAEGEIYPNTYKWLQKQGSPIRRCVKCLRSIDHVKKCSGCAVVLYCDYPCQVADWDHHRTVCKQLRVPILNTVD